MLGQKPATPLSIGWFRVSTVLTPCSLAVQVDMRVLHVTARLDLTWPSYLSSPQQRGIGISHRKAWELQLLLHERKPNSNIEASHCVITGALPWRRFALLQAELDLLDLLDLSDLSADASLAAPNLWIALGKGPGADAEPRSEPRWEVRWPLQRAQSLARPSSCRTRWSNTWIDKSKGAMMLQQPELGRPMVTHGSPQALACHEGILTHLVNPNASSCSTQNVLS